MPGAPCAMPDADRASRRRSSLADLLVGGPVGLRETLQRLGPTFIKLGQFLALRPDIVPQEYCDELMGLLDHVPPFPWEEARSILVAHFGRDPSEVVELINPRPVAAGSLAQVHFARLKNGDEVAVKILRPNIEQRVKRDLRWASRLARLLELGRVSLVSAPSELLEELSGWMMQEIDLARELANLTRLYELGGRDASQKIPRPYPELSGPRVLVSEFLRGIPVSEILAANRSERQDDRDRVVELGVRWNRLAENLIHATLTQVFRHHFFHADVHPGNLLVLPGDVIGYVDFGLCDSVDETVRKEQIRYLSSVYNTDIDQMFKSLTEVLIPGPNSDVQRFRMEFMAEAKTWLGELGNAEDPSRAERSPIAQWMIAVMRAARRNGYLVPTRILSMYRALLTAESVATALSTDADLRRIGRDFFSRFAWEEAVRTIQPDNLQNLMLNAVALWKDSPAQLHQVLTDMAENRFTVNANVAEEPRVEIGRNRRSRLLVTSVLTIGVAILTTSPSLPAPFGVSLAWPFYAALAVLYLAVFVQWRRLR